jgi:S-adenosylmethionine/arginine decarboxylase-like enzyme
MEKNHKHLILNAVIKNPINSEENCNCWLAELVRVVDMDILIPPVSKYCDIEGNEGVTGTVVITTSHISIHIWPNVEKPYIRLDVYSCKDFCSKDVIKYVDETMGIVEEGHLVIDRNELKPYVKCCAGQKTSCQAKVASAS